MAPIDEPCVSECEYDHVKVAHITHNKEVLRSLNLRFPPLVRLLQNIHHKNLCLHVYRVPLK
jgi:hypothetical protein